MPRGGLDGAGADRQPVGAERPVVHTRRIGGELAALDPQDGLGWADHRQAWVSARRLLPTHDLQAAPSCGFGQQHWSKLGC